MQKKWICFWIALLASTTIFAQQEVAISRSDFKTSKDGFRDAWKAVGEGDDYYELGPAAFPRALEYYLKAYDYNPTPAALNYKIGVCYLYAADKEKALGFLQDAYGKDPNVASDVLFVMGQAYHFRYAFDKAIGFYDRYKASLSPSELADKKLKVERKIRACETGKEMMQDTARVFTDNLGPNVNSQWDDYTPLVTADDSLLFFTSRRSSTTGGKINPYNNQYFEDIYYSVKIRGKWRAAQNMGGTVNSDKNEAAVSVTPDGQTIYIFDGSSNNGDIFYSHKKGNEWGRPRNVSRKINSRYHESSVAISYDGKELFFITDLKGETFGKRDVFISHKDEDGDWGDPENIGNTINTPFNEEGVFLHADNQTLYFSSQGHEGMGGYDIFVSRRDENGNWSEPENLGYPINTPGDDLFITVAAKGKIGYYSSSRKGGLGGKDIYKITFLGPEKEHLQNTEDNLIASISQPVSAQVVTQKVEVKTQMLSLVRGKVVDANSGNAIEAKLQVTDNDTEEILIDKKTNSQTGEFLLSLPFGKNYGLAVDKEGYLFHSENFNVQDYEEAGYQDIYLDIKLKKIEEGAKIVLNNVFFESGKTKPIATSYPELDRLVSVMEQNPRVRVRILGHTDHVGSLEFNTKLSQQRAQGVVDYMSAQGVDKSRLEAVGKAFNDPIATNKTEAGRRKNRRVEAEIVN